MPAYNPIVIGNVFGRLTVLELLPERTKSNLLIYKCQCSCVAKTIINVPKPYLTSGDTKSCGCLRKETTSARRTIHGMSESNEHSIWCDIHRRCYNKNSSSYQNYGGRGITMSDEWKESFEAFYRDMGPRPSLKHTVERSRNDEGYNKDNCHWATREEQNNNTRANVFYEVDGEKLTIAQIAKKYAMPYATARTRLLFMPVEVAVIPSIKFHHYKLTLNGRTQTMKEWLVERNITANTFVSRRYKGWTMEEALLPVQLTLVEFEGEVKTLESWCKILGYSDPDKIYLRYIRRESFDHIVKSNIE